MGKQTRKTLLQYLRDKGIPIREAIELLEKIEREEQRKNGSTSGFITRGNWQQKEAQNDMVRD